MDMAYYDQILTKRTHYQKNNVYLCTVILRDFILCNQKRYTNQS